MTMTTTKKKKKKERTKPISKETHVSDEPLKVLVKLLDKETFEALNTHIHDHSLTGSDPRLGKPDYFDARY